MRNINVLVFPCGSEVALEVYRSLKDVPFITLYGGSSVEDHGMYCFKNYFGNIPFFSEPDFLDKFNEICANNAIDFIYPAMDHVMEFLSNHSEQLHSKLIAPEQFSVTTCASKINTYHALEGEWFLPKIYYDKNSITEFPVIIKPDRGYGSRGFEIIKTQSALEDAINRLSGNYVICEYLPGEEYTVDCFTDRKGTLCYVSLRNRKRIRTGISVCSEMLPEDPCVMKIAEVISTKLHMRGAWFFQIKRDNENNYKLMEAATRIAGTSGVNRIAGINLPLLNIYDYLEMDISVPPKKYAVKVDRALHSSFEVQFAYSEVYVDYDDTLIIKGAVNTTLLGFLYRCVERKIPVHLLSKHTSDLNKALDEYCICNKLFTSIIRVPQETPKYEYISPKNGALFIDDSFRERTEMEERFGIVCVGPECVEGFINS